MTKVIKRNGTLVDFNKNKIYTAIMKAMKNGSGIIRPKIAENIEIGRASCRERV